MPFLNAWVAGSLPVLLSKQDLSLSAIAELPINTLVEPFFKLLAKLVFGQGKSMGPAAGAGGLQQGSGNTVPATPCCPTALQQIS